MYTLMSTPLCNYGVPLPTFFILKHINNTNPKFLSFRKPLQIHADATNEVDSQTGTLEEEPKKETLESEPRNEGQNISSSPKPLDKDLKRLFQKTAATFAPRASTATKNPAVPGTALYTVFEVQGYVSLLLGGALSFNLIFPSNEPDIWIDGDVVHLDVQ
ncbi:protein RESISTANCE TO PHYTOPHTHORA 1, chloroplastic-like [Hibiscus syriacus]|uniref:protein RESISTANCE TO PHYTOPHTHORA 1, chloroplastic-like n=1 Tax=Hibiscus syriacus TaxID=106335 RepID=UPI0019209133|nr:protein RESISTANCE TO PHYTOPHTHORA 1, chloroplastic-like [Hibiscus syriacus]